MKNALVGIALLFMAGFATAAIVPDQEQTLVNLGTLGNGFGVGQPGGYQLAQTTKASFDGFLVRVDIPMACEGGWLSIDITAVSAADVPTTTVLSHTEIDAAAFPVSDGYIWRSITLRSRVRVSAGDRFAIVLTNKSGRCGVGMGSSEDLYIDGRSLWRYEFTPPGVWMTTGGLADPVDAAFRTYIDVPNLRPSACTVDGFDRRPFTPVCECTTDAERHETRCGLFTSEMLLVRRMPYPIRAGQPLSVKWTLIPLVPMTGTLVVQDSLEQAVPLWFTGVPVGQMLTLQYNALAPASGTVRLGTDITGVENGHLQTVVGVLPQ